MAPRSAFIALFVALALHAALPEGIARDWLYVAIGLGAAALIAVRGGGWRLLAAGIVLMLAGDVTGGTLGAALYLAMTASVYVALVLLLRRRLRPFPIWLTIDGILAGLTLAALASLIFDAVRDVSEHDTAALAVTLGNVVADLLMLVVVLIAFAATNWRPGREWWLLGAGLALSTLGDTLWVIAPLQRLDTLWPAALVVAALAAWQQPAAATRPHVGWAMATVPLAGSGIAILTLVFAARPLTHALAAAALFAGIARAVLMLRENFQLLRTARHEAFTDKLTDLPNRRALMHDLDKADGTRTLVFFDLDRFKDFNDSFGHHAGDALLRRLAPALASVGRAYRLGGDEFCLLVPGALSDEHPLVAQAVEALTEDSVGASHGLVVLPDDAQDATEALRIADERMYVRKRSRRAAAVTFCATCESRAGETLTQLCQGSATLAVSGRADDQRGS